LHEMREFADRVAESEAHAQRQYHGMDTQRLEDRVRVLLTNHRAREHAAAQFSKLAADMMVYDRIANGACVR
jgi:hypothetical protein